MQQYFNTSRVSAKPMTRIEYNQLRGWQLSDNEKDKALDIGYLVINHTVEERNVDGFDGYVSWLPSDAFHQQYKMFGSGISFGDAVNALKSGAKVSRQGWNGKGMYLVLILGSAVEYAINERYGNPHDPTDRKQVLDAIYMKTADGKLVPWLASQTDILSTDWEII